MPLTFGWLYRRLHKRYLPLFLVFEIGSATVITLATVGLLSLYQDMGSTAFWRITLFAEACVLAALVYTLAKNRTLAVPVERWLKQGRPAELAPGAWRAAVSMPRDMIRRNGWLPFAIVGLPVGVFVTLELSLPVWSFAIFFAAAMIAVAYAVILHFFAAELFLRPVIEDIACQLPGDWAGSSAGVPLRWKLLGALPLINVITGVVVSGLSAGSAASISDLGVDVVVAVVVAFTISLELTVLLTKSITRPVDRLLAATERVKRGDFATRVPVISGDEMGALAGSFNEMVEGLAERRRLHQALGSYVDPDVAERVLEEGDVLEGEEAEVTVLFVDVRDFTPFAERSSARETVAFLNGFFEVVVPILLRHGGHANKFMGDGLLGVFGAPEAHPDHADRALAAAGELAATVADRWGDELRVGVGLNSGPVVVGSVGGGGRLEFAVIGDAVNVAARVEGVTRETGDTVLLTEATRCLLTRPGKPELEGRGELPLKGKRDPIPLYAALPIVELDERSTPMPQDLIAGS